MRQTWANMAVPPSKPRTREYAGVRMTLLLVVCLLASLGIGAIWFYRATRHGAEKAEREATREEAATLSAGTMAVLHRLDSPVEIRFYALLDPASVSAALQAFAGRVDQLLSAYQEAAKDKIKVTRYNPRTDSNSAAAAADGLKPFNLDTGDACYLGLTVVQDGRKESIPRLFPEWEQAVESDLSRAIARVVNPTPTAPAAVAALPIDPATIAEVKQQIPNFASISMQEGTQILRESALKDLKLALSEMEGQLKEAEQRVIRMQEAKSEAAKQAALKDLQRLQAEQSAKLRDAAARSSAQIEALRQLKEAAR